MLVWDLTNFCIGHWHDFHQIFKLSVRVRHTKTRQVKVVTSYWIRLGLNLSVKNCYKTCMKLWDSLHWIRLTTGLNRLYDYAFICSHISNVLGWELVLSRNYPQACLISTTHSSKGRIGMDSTLLKNKGEDPKK